MIQKIENLERKVADIDTAATTLVLQVGELETAVSREHRKVSDIDSALAREIAESSELNSKFTALQARVNALEHAGTKSIPVC